MELATRIRNRTTWARAENSPRTYQISGNSVAMQTPFPLTCCKVNATWWPLDPECPVTPTKLNLGTSTRAVTTLFTTCTSRRMCGFSGVVFVLLGVIIILPGVIMYISGSQTFFASAISCGTRKGKSVK